MPTVNVFFNKDKYFEKLEEITPQLKNEVAEELTCTDRKLNPNEVSVRLFRELGRGMLAPVELEIKAAAYKERVERQDQICSHIREFVLDEFYPSLNDAQIWLVLSELGHSFKEL